MRFRSRKQQLRVDTRLMCKVQIQQSSNPRRRAERTWHHCPLCHQPLTARDPDMSPRRQSRYLGTDKGCQRYRCHSIGSHLSALASRPRSSLQSTIHIRRTLAEQSVRTESRRPPGEAFPIIAGRYFGNQDDERLLHVEGWQGRRSS